MEITSPLTSILAYQNFSFSFCHNNYAKISQTGLGDQKLHARIKYH